jgi:thiol-disulfide isomerase/thioredoxin
VDKSSHLWNSFYAIFFVSKYLNYNGFIIKSNRAKVSKVVVMNLKLKNVRVTALIVFITLLLTTKVALAQKATVIKFDGLQEILDTKTDQIQVINFWATWCAPCIKELH